VARVLREDKTAGFVMSLLSCRFVAGDLEGPAHGRGWGRRTAREAEEAPVPLLRSERRTWWMFRDRFYWEDDDLDAEAVHALLLERERKKRRQIERAVDLMRAGVPEGPRREPISEEVRRAVFRRDGGRCVRCESAELLQFDHVIPVALGGASTLENLQLLCAICNREKGASL
jgi:5-methylcytosine-specific restriction endonuclease McrA